MLAHKFVDAVQQLNDDLGIPRHLDALREADIPALAEAARAEANTYPVPRYMTQQQCEALIRQVLPPKATGKAQSKLISKPAARTPAKKRRTAKSAA